MMKFSRLPALAASLLIGTTALLSAQPVIDAEGDVSIGSLTIEPTAVLELVSTSKGFLVPRMTEVQRDGIVAPADALLIFNTTTSEYNYWDPSTGQWEVFITSANIMDYAWVLEGNNLDVAVDPTLQSAYNGATGAFLGTTSADNAVIATTQNQAIDFFTNGTERFSVEGADGDIVPTNDNDIDLGSDVNRFAELYVNGSSVHIGPSGGEAANTEMELGYGASQGTITVDNTPTPQVIIDAAASRMYFNADGVGLDEVQINGAIDGVFINPDGSGPSEFFVNAAGDVIVMDPDGNGNNEIVVTPTTVDIDGNTFIDADDDGTQNLSVTTAGVVVDGDDDGTANLTVDAAGVSVDGDDDGNNDIFVDGTNGDVTVGNNTATDLMSVNGRVEQIETDGFDGYSLQESGSGNGFSAIESDDGEAYFGVESGFGNGMLLIEQDDGDGIFVEESGAGNGITIFSGFPGTALEVNGAGSGMAVEVNGGYVDGNFNSNEFGDGADQQQLIVNGDVGAIIGNTLAANPPEWDLVVLGDQVTTGLIKAGGSIWIDGFTPGNHQIVGNDDLNVGTITPNDLTLSTNTADAVVVDGGTQNVNILQDADVDGDMNVDGATTLQSTLDVFGIAWLYSNLNVNGATDLNSTLNVDGAVTINNTIDQLGGGDVNFSGNVDAASGLDVSGQDLTVDASVSIDAPGAGHQFGTPGSDAEVVRISGDPGNVGNYELVVDGDAQITGSLAIGGLTPGGIVYVNGTGNFTTDNPPFSYNDATNTVTSDRVNVNDWYEVDGATFLWNGPSGSATNTLVGSTNNTTLTGTNGTFLGNNAGANVTSGDWNTLIGQGAGEDITTGDWNTFVGRAAGGGLVSGQHNVVIGEQIGTPMPAAVDNVVLIGAHAQVSGAFNNATAIGSQAVVSQSNAMVLGEVGVVNVGIGTSTPSSRLDVVGSSELEGEVLINGATSTTNARLVVDNGHWTSQQTTGPTAAPAGANVVAATLTRATDVAGGVGVTTSGAPASGAQGTVTFAQAYSVPPIVTLTPANSAAAGVGAYVTRTVAGFTVNFMGVPAPGTQYLFFYQVIETQ